jgi:osmoprotectant transport system permease protein
MGQFLHYVSYRRSHIFHLTVEHAKIVVIAVILATIISVTLGVLVYRRERAAAVVLAVVGTFLTIPSFALFGLLIPIFGLGFNPTLVALTMYALLPITRNTVTGLRGVDEAVVESAQGMGMNRAQRLFRIELPLAWPVILTGIRVSTIITLGIAAIGAVVNGPGLGEDIFAGLARIGSPTAIDLTVSGILGVVLLALLFDIFYLFFGKVTTSKGIRA